MADLLPPVVAILLADTKRYTAEMDKAEGKMKHFGATSDATGSKVMAGMQRASTAIIGLGVGIAAYSVKAAINFQDLTTALVTGAGESEKNLKMVSDGILAMAGAVGQTPAELAKGLYMIESAGYHGAAGLAVLKAAAEGAATGHAQLETVAGAVTTAMHDYNISTAKATNVTSALIETVASGKTHLQDLAGSMGKVMPVAAALGISMQDVLGAMATMTNAGLSARLASMGLSNTLMSLSAPSKIAQSTLESFGLTSQHIKDTMNGPGGLSKALGEISTAVGQQFPSSSVQYAQAMRSILGGTVGFRTAVMLTGSHTKEFNTDVKNIGATMQGAQKHVQGFALVQKDLAFQLQSVKGSLTAGAISLGQWLLPKLSTVAGWATSVINFLKSKSLFSKIASDAVIGLFVGAVVLKLGKGISSIFSAGSSIVKGITGLATGKGLGGSLSKTGVMEVTANIVNVNGKGAAGKGLFGTGKTIAGAGEGGAGVAGAAGGTITALAGPLAVAAAGIALGLYLQTIPDTPQAKAAAKKGQNIYGSVGRGGGGNIFASEKYLQELQNHRHHLQQIAHNTSKGKQKVNIHIKAGR